MHIKRTDKRHAASPAEDIAFIDPITISVNASVDFAFVNFDIIGARFTEHQWYEFRVTLTPDEIRKAAALLRAHGITV